MALSTALFADGAATYDGKEFRQLVEMLVNGRTGFLGASTSMLASAQTVPDMTVKVAAGAAILDATGAGLFGNFAVANDADLTSPTFTVPGGSVRTDRLVLRVTGQTAALEVIAGTPGSATPPTVTGDNVIKVCRVEFVGGETTITSGKIVDEREFLGGGPYVCTSSSRPSSPFEGLTIFEKDTDRYAVWSGSAWRYFATTKATIAGIHSDSITAAPDDTGTITFGVTFASAPTVIGIVEVGSNADLVLNWTAAPGTTSVGYRVVNRAAANVTVSYRIHWIAVGDLG